MAKAKIENPEKTLDYIRKWYDLAARYRGCFVIGPYPYHEFLEGPSFWIWRGYDNNFYCVVLGARDLEPNLRRKLALKERAPIDERRKDDVKFRRMILDTSAIISELALKLIEVGLLRGSEILIPRAARLELQRMDEEGKRSRNVNLREKSRKGLVNISKLKSLHAEKRIKLIVDVLSKEAKESLDFFVKSVEKAVRATVMDEMISLTAEKSGGILLTGDRALALEALGRGIEVIFMPGDRVTERVKAYHMPVWKLHLLSMLSLVEGKELLAKILYDRGVLVEYKIGLKEDKLTIMKLT